MLVDNGSSVYVLFGSVFNQMQVDQPCQLWPNLFMAFLEKVNPKGTDYVGNRNS